MHHSIEVTRPSASKKQVAEPVKDWFKAFWTLEHWLYPTESSPTQEERHVLLWKCMTLEKFNCFGMEASASVVKLQRGLLYFPLSVMHTCRSCDVTIAIGQISNFAVRSILVCNSL